MIFKKEIQNYIYALFFLSLGGWLLHLRIHPVSGEGINPANFIPFILGMLNVFVVPFLFNFKKTFVIAYLINGFSVVIGVIVMAAFSCSSLADYSINTIFLKTTLADIFILLPKLFIGQMILFHYFPRGMGRMFTAFWWIRHFVYSTIVFVIGNYFWS